MLSQRAALAALLVIVVAFTFAAGFFFALLGVMSTAPGSMGVIVPDAGNFGWYSRIRVTDECVWDAGIDPETGEAFAPGSMGVVVPDDCDINTCQRRVVRTIEVGRLTWTRAFEPFTGWRGCIPKTTE